MKEINPEEFRSLVEEGKRLEELMEYYDLNEKNIRDILRSLKLRIKRIQPPKFKITENNNPMTSIDDLSRQTVEETPGEEAWVDSQEFEDWKDEDQKEYDEYNAGIAKEVEEEADYSRVSDEVYEANKDDLDKIENDLREMFGSGSSDNSSESNDSSDSDTNSSEPDISSQSWDF